MIFIGMLQQMSDCVTDGGTTQVEQNQEPDPFPSPGFGERFTSLDFPQPSDPSNLINDMVMILRQSAAVVERPIFALFA